MPETRTRVQSAIIVEALAAGDPEASEAAMRDHLSQVVDTLKSAIARHHAG